MIWGALNDTRTLKSREISGICADVVSRDECDVAPWTSLLWRSHSLHQGYVGMSYNINDAT
jgi:hypothetical protein